MRTFGVKAKHVTKGDMLLGAGPDLDGVIFNKVCGRKVPERHQPKDRKVALYPPFSTDLLTAMYLGWAGDGPLALGITCHRDEESQDEHDTRRPSRWWAGPLPMPQVADDAGLAEWEARGACSHRSNPMAICRAALRAVSLGIAARSQA